MKTRIIVLAACVAAVIALTLAGTPKAEALQATNMQAANVSLPYVDDANPCGAKSYVATITCCGDAKAKLKVTDLKTKKQVRVTKHRPRVWTVTMKRGRTYRISVKARSGAWKSIKYGIC